jgi:hypothetical protein
MVDLGSANSIGGLRALRRGLIHFNADLAALNPIIVVRGRCRPSHATRPCGRTVRGAEAAAKICAASVENHRNSETIVFDAEHPALKA